MIHDQQLVIRGLKDCITQQQNDMKTTQEKHNKWIKVLDQKIQKLTERNKELEEEKQVLEMKCSGQENPITDLQIQLDASTSR